MKVAHWTQYNGSGMNAVAESMVKSERLLGLDSILCNTFEDKDWSAMLDADVHVSHTWFPETYNGKSLRRQLTKPFRMVYVAHGTPEHVFHSAHEDAKHGGYGHGDALMLYQYWLAKAHARVTFWPRHQKILQSMCDTGTVVHCVPLGVDKEFWAGGSSKGKWAGSPSLWTGENPHYIKWPLDLLTMWPWVYEQLDGATLHCAYLATNTHRQFFPWANRNGAAYGAHLSPLTFGHHVLRDIFKSIDFFIGLVRYGDFNRLCLEANAAGAKTISYPGNPYSDFWVPEGDQRATAAELIRILKGEVQPRAKDDVASFFDTARAMEAIYRGIL